MRKELLETGLVGFGAPISYNDYTQGALPPNAVFTRNTTAWHFNESGVYVPKTANLPRFDYNPITKAQRGLLIEKQITNLLTRSEELDNASWSKTNVTIAANALAAPDGATTMDDIDETTGTGNHAVVRNGAVTVVANTPHTWSTFAAARERTRFALFAANGAFSNTFRSIANLSAGTMGSITNAGSGVGSSTKIEQITSAIYRAALTGTIDAASTTAQFGLYLDDNTGSLSYTGVAGSGIASWGQQLEQNPFPTSYIPTTSAAVTRNADLLQITGGEFTNMFNPLEGTFIVDFMLPSGLPVSGVHYIASFDDAGGTNEIIGLFWGNGSNTVNFLVADGAVQQANLQLGAVTFDVRQRAVFTYKANNFAACLNGGTLFTDTAGTLPTVNRLSLGARGDLNNDRYLNGWLMRHGYWNFAIPDAAVQAISGL